MDLRNKGTLLTYYVTPLVFFFVMGAVFSSTTPLLKSTLAASMTIFSVTMGSVMGTPTPLVQMRESGIIRAFRVNGIPGAATLAVSALSAFLHLLIVSMIIYLISPITFHSMFPQNAAAYFGTLALFLFASVGIGMLIGVVARGQAFATMLSMLIFLPSLLLSGIMFPTSMLPKALDYLGRIFPATYALQAFYGYGYGLRTDIDPGFSLCFVAVLGAVAFLLAAVRFEKTAEGEKM